ncbi:MAG: hypothetical protein SV062_05950 [Thermodesulfobacteriota bacterium]|nr:hypothetical protein [Thermodesulfobacteriota bacterium]
MKEDNILYKKRRADELVFNAWAAFEEGMIPQALTMARQAIVLWKNCEDAYNIMAMIALNKKEFSEAARFFETGRKKAEQTLKKDKIEKKYYWSNPRANVLFKALYGIGLVHYLQGNLKEAEKEFSNLLTLDLNDRMRACGLLGEIYHKLGNFSGAKECYLNTCDISGSLYNYALLLFKTKELDNAVLHLRKGFFTNIYIPPILLGAEILKKNCCYDNSSAEIRYAEEYVERCRSLWTDNKDSIKFLISVWEDHKVMEELEEFIKIKREFGREGGIKKFEIINRINEMKLPSRLFKNNPEISSRVRSKII